MVRYLIGNQWSGCDLWEFKFLTFRQCGGVAELVLHWLWKPKSGYHRCRFKSCPLRQKHGELAESGKAPGCYSGVRLTPAQVQILYSPPVLTGALTPCSRLSQLTSALPYWERLWRVDIFSFRHVIAFPGLFTYLKSDHHHLSWRLFGFFLFVIKNFSKFSGTCLQSFGFFFLSNLLV